MAVSALRRSARHHQRHRLLTWELTAPQSVTRALNHARIVANIDTEQLALDAGVGSDEVAAIDAGRPAAVPGAVEFLKDLDRLATVLGLPSAEVVEETLVWWAQAFAKQTGSTPRPPAPVEPVASETGETGEAHSASGTSLGPQRQVHRAERWLRAASFLVAVLVVAAGGGLAFADASTTNGGSSPRGVSHQLHISSTPGALLTLAGADVSSASYLSPPSVLSVSFVVNHPSWLEVTDASGVRVLGATIGPGTTAPVAVIAPFTVQIGAGGTMLVVSGENRSQDLTPPSAPFIYRFSPR
jgi:hypothetical protein